MEIEEIHVIIDQIIIALKYLHHKGISHNNLLPTNIYITTEDLHIKLGSLGLRSLSLGEGLLPMDIYALAYTAPENIKSSNIKLVEDIWALGCICFQLLTLKQAFHAGIYYELQEKIVKGLYQKELLTQTDCPQEIAKLIDKMLSLEINKRPSIFVISGNHE